MMREGLAQLISNEPDLIVCGESGRGQEAVELVDKLNPDLLLADISLPDKNGIEVIKDVRTIKPGLSILVISMHDESLYAERVLRAGARGYIMKQEGGRKLMAAIRQVLSGQIYLSEKMSSQILESLSGGHSKAEVPSLQKLTDREFEVLQMVGQGKGTREISQHLHLSVKTIEAHRANIKRKLNLRTGPELIRFAVRWVESQKPA